jgi:C1A family cysteine protease
MELVNFNKNNINFSLPRDQYDSRDFIYNRTKVTSVNYIDFRNECSPIENQGQLGSCTGQAIAGAIECINRRSRKNHDVSRLFIYYQERVLMNTINEDSGATIRDGIKSVSKWGAPLETFWPYNIKRFAQAPNKQAYTDALKRKVTEYRRIVTFSDVINAVSQKIPVIFGFAVYESFVSDKVAYTGVMPDPSASEEFLGGHAVMLVGFDKSSKRFIVRNSWGANWGLKGYFYMPFSVVENSDLSWDFWTITKIQNP